MDGADQLLIDLAVLHLRLAERGRNSKSYGSHADAYEVAARWVQEIIQCHPAVTLDQAGDEALTGAALGRWCYENPNLAARTIEGLRAGLTVQS